MNNSSLEFWGLGVGWKKEDFTWVSVSVKMSSSHSWLAREVLLRFTELSNSDLQNSLLFFLFQITFLPTYGYRDLSTDTETPVWIPRPLHGYRDAYNCTETASVSILPRPLYIRLSFLPLSRHYRLDWQLVWFRSTIGTKSDLYPEPELPQFSRTRRCWRTCRWISHSTILC